MHTTQQCTSRANTHLLRSCSDDRHYFQWISTQQSTAHLRSLYKSMKLQQSHQRQREAKRLATEEDVKSNIAAAQVNVLLYSCYPSLLYSSFYCPHYRQSRRLTMTGSIDQQPASPLDALLWRRTSGERNVGEESSTIVGRVPSSSLTPLVEVCSVSRNWMEQKLSTESMEHTWRSSMFLQNV